VSREPILVIGAGKMGGALIKGCLAAGLGPVVAVEPGPSPALRKAKGVSFVAAIESLPNRRWRACVVALKPQVLKTEASKLKPIAASGALMVSIAAGTGVKFLAKAWGRDARIIRAMPNTPGAIGRGVSALYAAPKVRPKDRALANALLGALGQTVWVAREALIDSVTAVSGSGPAYVFALVEALTEAAIAEGLAPAIAEKLARATVSGSGALLDVDPRAPAELRRDVTSPGGTTEAALRVLLAKSGLTALMARTVKAAAKRARELSR